MSGWDDPVGRIRELERRLSAVRALVAEWSQPDNLDIALGGQQEAVDRLRAALEGPQTCEVAPQGDARGQVDQNHTAVIPGRQIEGEG